MLGAPKEDIVNSKCCETICSTGEEDCPISHGVRKNDSSESLLVNAGSREVPVQKTISHISVSGRKYVIESFIDITERKRLEAQFQQARRMEALGTLADGIAHDFNNFLMGILGNASLMLIDKDSDDPNYERLKNIEEYVQNAADLTQQLLGFARGGKYEAKPTDLNSCHFS